MAILNGIMSYEYLIAMVVIFIVLPLIPNKKLRFYTCYIGFGLVLTLCSLIFVPLSCIRPRNLSNVKFGAKLFGYYTHILGIEWIIRRGEILKKKQEAVLACNHQSFFDTLGVCRIWDFAGDATVICKKEVLYYFPLGTMFWLAGMVFIDRMDPQTSKSKIEATVHYLRDLKAKLWIFPEGTRNKQGNNLLPFKKGAFSVAIATQVPVIPIVFSPFYFIDSDNKTFSKGKMIISVLDVISTEGLTLDDIDSLKEKTHKLMSDEYEKLQKEIENLQQVDDL